MKSELDYARVGERIRLARERAGLTQAQLGEQTDLSTAHIGHIERGTRIASLETIFRIAQALHTSTDFFLLDTAQNDVDAEAFARFLVSSLKDEEPQKVRRFCNIVRLLRENLDDL